MQTVSYLAQNIRPCVCFTQKYYQNKPLDPKVSELDQMFEFIQEFAKSVMHCVIEKIHSCLDEDKFKGKFKVIQHNILTNCFDQKEANVNGFSLSKIDLANIEMKFLTTNDNVSNMSNKNKKRKPNSENANQRFWDGVDLNSIYTSNSSQENKQTLTLDDCPSSNTTLQCHFISEKTYFIYFTCDKSIPKWFVRLLSKFGNWICTCQLLNEDTNSDPENKD